MNSMSFNKKLAVLGFILAFLAMIFSFFTPDGLNGVHEKPNYISILTLAEKIKSREHLDLIDLRSEAAYLKFHLPTAQKVSVNEWLSNTITHKDTIVFYSGDDKLTQQLWQELPDTLKPKVKILYGGVHDWYERLLYIKLPVTFPTKDSVIVERIKILNKFYGGRTEFIEDHHLLDYYHTDLTKMGWKHHKGSRHGLVRKGC